MQTAIIQLMNLGQMPDARDDDPTAETIDSYDRLLGEVITPLTQEEVKILMSLFPKSGMYGVEWSLLHLAETYLIDNPLKRLEYRRLITACPSEEWRETMQVRLENWEKKTMTRE